MDKIRIPGFDKRLKKPYRARTVMSWKKLPFNRKNFMKKEIVRDRPGGGRKASPCSSAPVVAADVGKSTASAVASRARVPTLIPPSRRRKSACGCSVH